MHKLKLKGTIIVNLDTGIAAQVRRKKAMERQMEIMAEQMATTKGKADHHRQEYDVLEAKRKSLARPDV